MVAGVAAAGDVSAQRVVESEQMTVTATRSAREAFAVPGVVTVIDAEEIEASLVTDIKDLVRFEPGVSVRSSAARFNAQSATGRDGNSGFNIRGLEDNRVLITVDGVRVPDGFSFGPAGFGRGDYVDLDLLQSVEIVRGPASALYGSDGVAGVVSFITKAPEDFLASDQSFGARARVLYSSADDSWAEGASAAGRWGDWSAIASYSRRDGHEQENQGENEALNSTRTAPNPQDFESNAAMARLVFEPNDANRFRLTLDYSDRNVVTEVYSARSAAPPPPPFQTVLDFDAEDESVRKRIAFDHTYMSEGGLIDRAFWAAYYQSAEITELHPEDRNLSDRTRLTTFDNSVWSVTGQLESSFNRGGVTTPLESIDPWKLVAGLSYHDPNGRSGGQFIVTHVGEKDAQDTAPGNFRPDAFTILDLTAYWHLTDRATLRAGVFNASDETYWWWSDVRGVLAASSTVDAFTQPGRNFSASISYRF